MKWRARELAHSQDPHKGGVEAQPVRFSDEARSMVSPDAFELMDEWGPERIVYVQDHRTGMKGVLVLDNTARGIGKGGTRMSPTLTVAEVARLARTMTWKWAAADLFFGGAKAGILGDPNVANKEDVLRAFARALANEVPAEYVFGLDMGLSEQDAAIFVDELGDRAVSTGLPEVLGGMPYDKLGVTGFGVAEALDEAVRHTGGELAGSRVVVQGFGAVGAHAAKRLAEQGAVIVGISNVHGTLADPDGLDIPRLFELREKAGDDGIREYGVALTPTTDALLLDADIVVPAARQDVISDDVAGRISAGMVVEGANLPSNPSSRAIMHERGITVVPDFIANAGGIIAAAHSMDARGSGFLVDPSRIFEMVTTKVRANTAAVLDESARTHGTTHEAALDLAQGRVREAMRMRGQWRRNEVA